MPVRPPGKARGFCGIMPVFQGLVQANYHLRRGPGGPAIRKVKPGLPFYISALIRRFHTRRFSAITREYQSALALGVRIWVLKSQ